MTRGTPLNSLGGVNPFAIPVDWARYFVYFDATCNVSRLTSYDIYTQLFKDSVTNTDALHGADNPDLSAFRAHGGKLLLWHGFADPLIMPQGTIEYYDYLVGATSQGSYGAAQQFARLFLAPGVGHCGGGNGPQPQNLFNAVVIWVEKGQAPDTLLASQVISGVTRTRPLCPYPQLARYVGTGDANNAANFVCQ